MPKRLLIMTYRFAASLIGKYRKAGNLPIRVAVL